MIQPLCISYLPRTIAIHRMGEGKLGGLGGLGGLVVDSGTGQARYALVQCDGPTEGVEKTAADLRLVPWNALRFVPGLNRYLSSISPEKLQAAPTVSTPALAEQRPSINLFLDLCRHFGLSLSGHSRC